MPVDSSEKFIAKVLKDKSEAAMINATKEAYHLLMRIPNFVSHFDHSNGCHFQKCYDNLGYILSLCCHFRVSVHNKAATNDLEARKH